MKYFIRILFVFVLAVGVVTGMYYYTTGGPSPSGKEVISLTTVTKPPATEKNSNRVLLASLEKEDFKLYKSKRVIILTHGDREYEFNNWSSMIDEEAPELYYHDFDGDDEKELIVRAVEDFNEAANQYIYCLYILDPVADESGNEDFKVIFAGKEEWSNIFNEQIKLEVSQLKKCKKYVQFAMDVRSKTIKYNKETGIALNDHKGYAKALSDGAEYLTVNQMSKANGIYTIDKNKKINVDVDINVTYKENGLSQKIGVVHFQLSLKNSELFVTSKSMYFTANEQYKISDPTVTAPMPWSYTENNADKSAVTGGGVVDWLKCKTSFDPSIATQTVTYENNTTDIDHVASITITESFVQIVAKQGCTFDVSVLEKGEYSVIINEGTENEYDIAYNTEVSGNILKINFDKTYPSDEIKELSVNFGAK